MKKIVIGILAHVDAGKTTLSERLLYLSGEIRKPGRVDHKDAFFDTDIQERERGITIFSKQTVLSLPKTSLTLIDTPGHVDFSAEMERTLRVLDYAILVISGTHGIQPHTRTLWQLLARYQIPAFIFINKMDLVEKESGEPAFDPAASALLEERKKSLIQSLQEQFSEGCLSFESPMEKLYESMAITDEKTLSYYLDHGEISLEMIRDLIFHRRIFPVYFGSALSGNGVDDLVRGLDVYMREIARKDEFSARIFKITHEQGRGVREANNKMPDLKGNNQERLTWMKITGGSLSVKSMIGGEKIDQIRLYKGEKYELIQTAYPGDVIASTGLMSTRPGQIVGSEAKETASFLGSFLSYQVIPEDEVDLYTLHKALLVLEQEDPELHVIFQEKSVESSSSHEESFVEVRLMGEVQLEVLSRMLRDRFGIGVHFSEGKILYQETLEGPVIGYGHYEPLRHYAEVHLLLEPGLPGSGVAVQSDLSTDRLGKNFQHLILTHLTEKVFPGVLTGAPLTDVRIHLIDGRSHVKHTEGGDFREATYRAVRQGLMKSKSVLLEPFYEFELRVPSRQIGRAMNDLERLCARFSMPETDGSFSILKGKGPVSTLRSYSLDVQAYTGGEGSFLCTPCGYEPCHNPEEVIEATAYEAVSDLENSPDSVFCAHGAGFLVPWFDVESFIHLENKEYLISEAVSANAAEPDAPEGSGEVLAEDSLSQESERNHPSTVYGSYRGTLAEDRELLAIFEHTYGKIDRSKDPKGASVKSESSLLGRERKHPAGPSRKPEDTYLLIDGYNVIFAWEKLKEAAEVSLENARAELLELMKHYQSFRKYRIIVVFDAYNVKRNTEDVERIQDLVVVYTKEAQTADTYIERASYELRKEHAVRVVTSDAAEQLIVFGHGAERISAGAFYDEVKEVLREIDTVTRTWNEKEKKVTNPLFTSSDAPLLPEERRSGCFFSCGYEAE